MSAWFCERFQSQEVSFEISSRICFRIKDSPSSLQSFSFFFRYSLSCSFQAIWFSARSKFWSDLKLLMVIPVPLLSAVLDGFNVFYCRFIHRWNHSGNVAGWLVMIQCCNGSERRTHPETLNGSIVSKTRRTTWHMTQRFFMAGPLFFRILGIFFRPYSHGSWHGGKSLTSLGVETPAVA